MYIKNYIYKENYNQDSKTYQPAAECVAVLILSILSLQHHPSYLHTLKRTR